VFLEQLFLNYLNVSTYRNIDELQEQNQKLLAVIRELSDKQEEEENMAVDAKYTCFLVSRPSPARTRNN
jgi:hypothetical protein